MLSTPELFMSTILEGLDGVLCQMDNVLIFGATKKTMTLDWLQH